MTATGRVVAVIAGLVGLLFAAADLVREAVLATERSVAWPFAEWWSRLTTDPTWATGVAAAAALDGGRWAVVLTGELSDVVPDGHARVGVAVWDGANEERAGLGAVSSEWIPLEIV